MPVQFKVISQRHYRHWGPKRLTQSKQGQFLDKYKIMEKVEALTRLA